MLPIEIWHLGQHEIDAVVSGLFDPLGAKFIDAAAVRLEHHARRLSGWELKAYAILHSSFREVMLLDADNVPVTDPDILFGSPGYNEHGALFWPDEGPASQGALLWNVLTEPGPPAEPRFETGQLLVDKARAWTALRVAKHLNDYSEFYYPLSRGDAEIFHVAMNLARCGYQLIRTPMRRLHGAMCQYDHTGRLLFQHRNGDKWSREPTRSIEGFQYEDECRGFLAELERSWSPARTLRMHGA
jgi:Mannosyltransferase putative